MAETFTSFKHGDRVRCKRYRPRGCPERGGWTGVIARLPGEVPGIAPNLAVVELDHEKDEEGKPVILGIDPSLLEPE